MYCVYGGINFLPQAGSVIGLQKEKCHRRRTSKFTGLKSLLKHNKVVKHSRLLGSLHQTILIWYFLQLPNKYKFNRNIVRMYILLIMMCYRKKKNFGWNFLNHNEISKQNPPSVKIFQGLIYPSLCTEFWSCIQFKGVINTKSNVKVNRQISCTISLQNNCCPSICKLPIYPRPG